ncbi:hypothetical protein MHYP_G00327780 [Metynnis hypsauchen]
MGPTLSSCGKMTWFCPFCLAKVDVSHAHEAVEQRAPRGGQAAAGPGIISPAYLGSAEADLCTPGPCVLPRHADLQVDHMTCTITLSRKQPSGLYPICSVTVLIRPLLASARLGKLTTLSGSERKVARLGIIQRTMTRAVAPRLSGVTEGPWTI